MAVVLKRRNHRGVYVEAADRRRKLDGVRLTADQPKALRFASAVDAEAWIREHSPRPGWFEVAVLFERRKP